MLRGAPDGKKARARSFYYQTAAGQTSCHDLHATILELPGIDHRRLTVRHNGIDRRLPDIHGEVLREVLA